ncbi:Transcription factor, K-box [Dillenia turbinata]|uniref:Transcription factor, K-box n=1 Tax=Dillenia turbinata TaxID=194707 RepID=A0AAN8ZT07_9MAGN
MELFSSHEVKLIAVFKYLSVDGIVLLHKIFSSFWYYCNGNENGVPSLSSRVLVARRCPSYCCVLANGKVNVIKRMKEAFNMQKITDRHRLHRSAENNDQLAQPSLDLQLEDSGYAMLSKDVAEKTHELRQLRGEELKELSIEELKALEQLVERGLNRVMVMKHEKIMNEISALERKMANLLENAQALFAEQGQSSESVITNICSAANAPFDHEGLQIMQYLYSSKH